MAAAIAPEQAQHLRALLEELIAKSPGLTSTAKAAFERLVDVLEASPDAVVFAADSTMSSQEAAALLGVSRMTVVRLIERGKLAAEGGAVHRRISVFELARYQREATARRRHALTELASDIDHDTPPDQVIKTR